MQECDFDVLIVGAGISGIGAAYHLQTECPGKRYAILEGREALGGTWDLFRYPGIRSDSDMHTLGYSFRPWNDPEAIADGPAILSYLIDTATEYGIDQHIRFQRKVLSASWSSETACWTVSVLRVDTGEKSELTCNFLFMCTGYYSYEAGYTPEFAGVDEFEGQVVHPQNWTPDVAYDGLKVVVIGSGATAVTLVPELAKKAAHVTMLQRSPTYVLTLPREDPLAVYLGARMPDRIAYGITRWRNIVFSLALYNAARKAPKRMKKLLMQAVQKELGPGFDVETHFNPSYDPWDQRLCFVPDSDLFIALREGRADVVTDHIETFTPRGIRLRSGAELEADLIVTATGLNLCFMSDIEVSVDGETIAPNELWTYKGMMFSGVPNLALWFGYTNQSWTLKADLTSTYVCRLLGHMERNGYRRCVPRVPRDGITERPFLDLDSGYINRHLESLPKQGKSAPWRVYQNYLLDLVMLRFGKLEDGTMELS